MTTLDWRVHVEQCIDAMKKLDWGYPIGDHKLGPAADEQSVQAFRKRFPHRGANDLLNFLQSCDGVSLPDVHSGYFLHSIEKILRDQGHPSTLSSGEQVPILSFGSDGGGGLFAIRLEGSTEVYHLPPGKVNGAVYDDRTRCAVVVAPTFQAFLERLLADVRAFIAGDEHVFMSDVWKGKRP